MCANLKISANINKSCAKVLLVLQDTVLCLNEGVLHSQHENCMSVVTSAMPALED